MRTRNHILIVGAGLVGSLLARLLAMRGNTVTVLDYRPDPRESGDGTSGRSINLTLCHRGWTALASAGLQEEVEKIALPLWGRVIHTREGLKTQAYGRKGDHIYAISRDQLSKLLITAADDLPEVHFLFQTRCLDLDIENGSVEVIQRSESTSSLLEADLIIGADGAHSIIRTCLQTQGLLTSSLESLDYGYKEMILRKGLAKALERQAFHLWPRKKFMIAASPNLDGNFTATLLLPYTGPQSFAELSTGASVFSFFEEFFPDCLDYLPDLETQFFGKETGALHTLTCRPWTHGNKVLLIGDASHAITPFYGQGMNSGFEDCYELCHQYDRYDGDWASLLPAWSAGRIPNTQAIADLALAHFLELRDHVSDPQFLLKKKIEARLYQEFPTYWIPMFSLISFTDTPYQEAIEAGKKQAIILAALISIPEVRRDWETMDFSHWIDFENLAFKPKQ